MAGDKGAVCVTGGTSYVGSWLIKLLLEQGYSVHTTVRADPEKKRDLSFLTSLPGADERLKFFAADLNSPESFDACVEGCRGVFHLASPMDFENKEPEAVKTQRAIDGTIGLLKSCIKAKTVKRVIYTSSIAAVYFNDKKVEMMDESYWTDLDYVRGLDSYLSAYAVAKTLTEKAAIEFAAEHGLDLLTVIPPMVVGPFIVPQLHGSAKALLSPILGSRVDYKLLIHGAVVHLDDLSNALIFLLEHPEAKGRYNCSNAVLTIPKVIEVLSTKYPEYKIDDSLAEVDQSVKMPDLSSKKLVDLGFEYKYGIEDMYDGAIKSCRERGILNQQRGFEDIHDFDELGDEVS